mmetsp:Transcript_6234/g.11902  ORF Transcript_6234/g.11902 Transcript_6234/m.11902 type:complete len:88 (+) Transcript_6234:313-576(+)
MCPIAILMNAVIAQKKPSKHKASRSNQYKFGEEKNHPDAAHPDLLTFAFTVPTSNFVKIAPNTKLTTCNICCASINFLSPDADLRKN